MLDLYDNLHNNKLKKEELYKLFEEEKKRIIEVISETHKLTVLMACAGSADTLFRIAAIDENDRQHIFNLIESKIKTLPVEEFRM